MWLQKRLNKRVIKMAIGSKYVYEIEAEEKVRWVNELKKEIKKDIN